MTMILTINVIAADIAVEPAGTGMAFTITATQRCSLQLSTNLSDWITAIPDSLEFKSVTVTRDYAFARLAPPVGTSLSLTGTLSIGQTNIFQNMDIGITRVVDRGENGKAWINIAQVDSWPNWTMAGEWWVNTGIHDCVAELSWLANDGRSNQIIMSTAENQLYIEMLKDGQSLVRIQPSESPVLIIRNQTGQNLMSLDSQGNLSLAGKIAVNGAAGKRR